MFMSTLKDCLYATIHRNRKPLKAIAEELGMSENYLTRSALPDLEESETGSGCRFPLKKLVPLIRATGDFSVLDHIEDSLGRVAIPIPKAAGASAEIVRLTMKSVKEFGELMSVLDDSIADGRLTGEEIARLRSESYDAIQAISALMYQIENVKKQP
jgi:hypothetical protein